MILNLTIIVILCLVLIFFSVQLFFVVFRSHAPFISTRAKLIKSIVRQINLPNNGVVYELGCGNAGFLRELGRKHPEAELLGVEKFFWPWLIAQTQDALYKNKVSIVKDDIFNLNLTRADLIYCFLNTETMKKVADKIKNEGKPGAVLISYQFKLPGHEPYKTIEENNDRVYFYQL